MSFYYLVIGEVYNEGTLWTDIIFAICTVLLLGRFELKVRTIVARVAEAAALFFIASGVDVLLYYIGLSGYPGPTFLALFGTLAFYALFQKRLNLLDRVVRSTTFCSLFVILVGVTGTITTAFPALQDFKYGYDIPSWISYVLMFVLIIFIRRFTVVQYNYVPKGFAALIVAVDVLGGYASQVFLDFRSEYTMLNDYEIEFGTTYGDISESIAQINIFVNVVFIFLVLAMYFMFYALAREHEQRAELLVTKRSDADSADVASMTKTMYEQLREMRHEIKNHDAYLLALLEAEDYDKLREVLVAQTSERAETLNQVASGNPIVDAVVNSKMTLARSQGIELKTMLAVPEELPYDEDDLFRLLANLLDNAIEGTRAAGIGGTITLTIMPEHGYWFVCVKNPCDPELIKRRPDGSLRTSKADSDVHGYGTRVIARIAEKYDGTASFKVDDATETFVASVMLGVKEEKKLAA